MRLFAGLLFAAASMHAATIVNYSFNSISGTAIGSPGVTYNFTGSSGSLTTIPGGASATATIGNLIVSVDPGVSHALSLTNVFPITDSIAGQANQSGLHLFLNFTGGQWVYTGVFDVPQILNPGFAYEVFTTSVTGGAADGITARPVTLTTTALVTPEPASLGLMGFALIVGLRTMRRRNRLS